MRKVFSILLLVAIVGASYFVVKTYFPSLIPAVIPAPKEVKKYLPLNSETLSPFKIPVGFKMDIFADFKNELPRVMKFDDSGNLLVTLTSTGKLVALTDTNNDKKSDNKVVLLSGLNKPHGIDFDGNYIYISQSNGVSRYRYDSKSLTLGSEELLFSLPPGGRHFTRTIKIHDKKLYTSVGSSCDVCVESNNLRASILVSNLDGSDLKVFARGLRNTVFFDFDKFGKMWGADMGRDNLGDNLPPDEINIIEEGKDYGWPYCYGSKIKDTKFNSDQTITCENTIAPVYELPAHNAPLGFVFNDTSDVFVALHGSWNSSVPVGYKVVKLSTFADGISGMEDYVTGFIQGKDHILGRPAGLTFDSSDNLYISDDKSGMIYILYK